MLNYVLLRDFWVQKNYLVNVFVDILLHYIVDFDYDLLPKGRFGIDYFDYFAGELIPQSASPRDYVVAPRGHSWS